MFGKNNNDKFKFPMAELDLDALSNAGRVLPEIEDNSRDAKMVYMGIFSESNIPNDAVSVDFHYEQDGINYYRVFKMP